MLKNLLNFIAGNWNFRSERDIFKEENSASDDSTVLQSDVKKSLENIRISNVLPRIWTVAQVEFGLLGTSQVGL